MPRPNVGTTVMSSRSRWSRRRPRGGPPVSTSTSRTPRSRPPGLQPVTAKVISRGTATTRTAITHVSTAESMNRPMRRPRAAAASPQTTRSIAPAMTRSPTGAGVSRARGSGADMREVTGSFSLSDRRERVAAGSGGRCVVWEADAKSASTNVQ